MEYIPVYRMIELDIKKIFDELEKKQEAFKKLTGIRCLEECGYCCENERAEATVAEFIPLAVHMWETARAESLLELLGTVKIPSRCIFYRPEGPGKGRCGIYPYRGFICRCFGFIIRKAKDNNYVFSTCQLIRKKYKENITTAEDLLRSGLEAPLSNSYALRIMAAMPGEGRKFFSINKAIKEALEKVGYMFMRDENGLSYERGRAGDARRKT